MIEPMIPHGLRWIPLNCQKTMVLHDRADDTTWPAVDSSELSEDHGAP